MHCALDLLFVNGRAGGVETYVRELVPAMGRVRPDVQVTAFVPAGQERGDWLNGCKVVPVEMHGPRLPAMSSAQVRVVGPEVRRRGVELLHSPANFSAVIAGRAVPTVVTVHDLLHRRNPDLVSLRTRATIRAVVDRPARRARRILTVSEASAADIVHFLGRRRDEIDVTPLAPRSRTDPLAARSAEPPGRHQVLSVGNGSPHKNLAVLVEAMKLVPASDRPHLVLPGRDVRETLTPLVRRLGLDGDVRLPGWVTESELGELFRSATAYVCPSLFEGFGLPVLEAMSIGLPVLCSDIPVLHEVAAGAAEFFDPGSAASVAAQLRAVLSDDDRRRDLSRLGLGRAAQFSWEHTARLTADAYGRALGGPPAEEADR